MAKAKKEETEDKNIVLPEDQLLKYLKDNKGNHYNDDTDISCIVSSGSLNFDVETCGGIRPGIVRLTGISGGGKSSAALAFQYNFLEDKSKKRRGLYCKAEGRLSEQIKSRSGIIFVENAEDWKDGTCFVFKSNIYETVIGLIADLVKNNTEGYQYFVIIDAMDALVPKGDIDKPFEEANKVAGGALLTSDFLRKMTLGLSSRGHICVMISQVRSSVSINPYAKTDPKLTNASGGNAALHYADWIFEFQQRFNKDIIWKGEENKSDRLGHYCRIIFRKSPNERDGIEVKYPICYGRTGGNSVWREYEVLDQLLAWNLVKRKGDKGAWFDTSPDLIKDLKEKNLEIPAQFHGMDKIKEYLEANKEVTDFIFNKFKETLTKSI